MTTTNTATEVGVATLSREELRSFAALVRASAPGRTAPSYQRQRSLLSPVDFATAIREQAPGRRDRS